MLALRIYQKDWMWLQVWNTWKVFFEFSFSQYHKFILIEKKNHIKDFPQSKKNPDRLIKVSKAIKQQGLDNKLAQSLFISSEVFGCFNLQIAQLVQQLNILSMSITSLVFCLAVLFLGVGAEPTFPSFEEYVASFSKAYPNPAEYAERKGIYEARVETMKQITDYEPGVNQMTDWRQEEIKTRSTLHQKSDNLRAPNYAFLPKKLRSSYPISLDLRGTGIITSVKDQGDCGSCWAFAAAAMAESKLLREYRFTGRNIDLSQQFLLRCTANSACDGGYMEEVLKKVTIPLEKTYPYQPYWYNTPQICSSEGVNIALGFNSYYNIQDDQIIALLNSVGPLVVGVSSSNWYFYSSGVFSCSYYDPVDHAVLLVGYTLNYWIIKNSWGPNFGMNGYIYISRSSTKNCRMGRAVFHYVGDGDSSTDYKFIQIIDGNSGGNSSDPVDPTPPVDPVYPPFDDNSTIDNKTDDKPINNNTTNSTTKGEQIVALWSLLGFLLMSVLL